jgi:hypothetical protein
VLFRENHLLSISLSAGRDDSMSSTLPEHANGCRLAVALATLEG